MMKHYLFGNEKDQENIKELMKSAISSKHLIPVLGSGFTTGTKTQRGEVPNVKQLTHKIAELIAETDEYKNEKICELETIELSSLANFFWKEMENTKYKKTLSKFQEYMEDNFTNVNDFPVIKRKFLDSGWRYIYTLNYDDAIESNLRIEKIMPYTRQNQKFIEQHHCLFKLHGDAKYYVKTGDSRYCILSQKQYLESIKALENYDMFQHLESDFVSNSFLFVGCSLDNELDILFASETNLQNKTMLNGDDSRIIYVRYIDSEITDLPLPEKMKLSDYGVTHVISVKGEAEMNQFYSMVYELNRQRENIEREDELEQYRGIHFQKLKEDDQRNMDYFFINERVSLKNGAITLPGFFINRTLGNELKEALSHKSVIHILTGPKMCGKTYLLLQLLKELPPERTYYLSIAVNDKVLEEITQKKNCIFLMDKGVLTITQIKSLFKKLAQMEKNNIKIVFVVDVDNKDFLEFYAEKQIIDTGLTKFFTLKNKFDEKELSEFNRHIAKLRLVDCKKQNTILDFLFKVEDTLIGKHIRILPQIQFLEAANQRELKAMIVLAMENVIPVSLANKLDIVEALFDLSRRFQITIQKDYLSDIEAEYDYSRYKFINNSPYWVMRCLSKCADSVSNHAAIASAFYSIIEKFEDIYRNNTARFNAKIKEYYMLDTLQVFFASSDIKGTLKLPNSIYEKLHGKLFDNFQFLHQEAKCELRVARREKSEDTILGILQKAFGNINRAIDLGEKSSALNIEYTLNHMKVTKALILSNYLLIGKQTDKINETIHVYYETFVEEKPLLKDDFLKKDDLKDVNNFLYYVIKNYTIVNLLPESKDKFEEIYLNRYGKRFSFD